MDDADIRTKVKKAIEKASGIAADEIPDNARFKEDLDLDSLTIVELVVEVQFEFKIPDLPDGELEGIQSIDDTIAMIRRELLREKRACVGDGS